VKLSKYLVPERVIRVHVPSKQEAIDLVGRVVASSPDVPDPDRVQAALREREALVSTGIGRGLAVPHVVLPGVKRLTLAVAVLEAPIPFESFDDQPIQFLFCVLAPPGAHDEYLRLLSLIVRAIKRDDVRRRLQSAPDARTVYDVLKEF
jgi:PTS system nitrogen regulatory IIA component